MGEITSCDDCGGELRTYSMDAAAYAGTTLI
jgi:hypothetical protein